jgi:hypothetical protein
MEIKDDLEENIRGNAERVKIGKGVNWTLSTPIIGRDSSPASHLTVVFTFF